MMERLGAAVGWALVGALLFYLLDPALPSRPDYPRVFVHREAIEQLEPDTVVRWRDRIQYIIPNPTQVATAVGGGVDDVRSFCAPTVLRVQGDTAAAPAPELLLRSGSLDRGWIFGSDLLRLTGPTSTGDLVSGTWNTRGSVSFVVVGDSVLVRRDRWALLKDVGTAGALFLLGREVGKRF